MGEKTAKKAGKSGRESRFLPEKKTKKTQKLTEKDVFFPREDFRKFTPEKPKILPEKKMKKCAREGHKVPEKNMVQFFFTEIFCIKYEI